MRPNFNRKFAMNECKASVLFLYMGSRQKSEMHRWKLHPMFVFQVQIVQSTDGVVPSRIWFMTSTMSSRICSGLALCLRH
jgi:hypothetical protein